MRKLADAGSKAGKKSYTGIIAVLSLVLIAIIAALFFMPGYSGEVAFDVTILPLLNALFNCFTFTVLLLALYAIKKRNINLHRNFIFAAFVSTTLFLVSYVTYHFLTEPTPFGGSPAMKGIYFFILITHILLAIVNVPLALLALVSGLGRQNARHRKLVRWTMPVWLYVSATGVLVYVLISPYY